MIDWKNLDKLAVYDKFLALKGRVNLAEAMSGENGAARVAKYSVPMACGMKYNFAAKAVDDDVLSVLAERLPATLELTLMALIIGLLASAALLLMNKENFGSPRESLIPFIYSIVTFVFAFFAINKWKMNPIYVLIICGAAGGLFYGFFPT